MPTRNSRGEEKRLKRWRSKCPQQIKERIGRAGSEVFFVVGRHPIDKTLLKYQCKFDIAGSTGNKYCVTIGKVQTCNCPDYRKRKDLCKHILFVMLRVIGLNVQHELLYQKAFKVNELDDLFRKIAKNKSSASSYFLDEEDGSDRDGVKNLISNMSTVTIENGVKYTNVRRITNQPSTRDTSTYRPYYWEKSSYYMH